MLSVLALSIAALLCSAHSASYPNDLDALCLTVSNVTNKDRTWSSSTPACQWLGITCDPDGSVRQIIWQNMGLGGVLDLATLPYNLQKLDVFNNQLTGNPNFAGLPKGLYDLDLLNNALFGSGSFIPQTDPYSGASLWCFTPMEKMCGDHDGVFHGMWSCAP